MSSELIRSSLCFILLTDRALLSIEIPDSLCENCRMVHNLLRCPSLRLQAKNQEVLQRFASSQRTVKEGGHSFTVAMSADESWLAMTVCQMQCSSDPCTYDWLYFAFGPIIRERMAKGGNM